MRFVLSLGILTLLGSSALAAPWDIVPLKDKTHQSATTRPVDLQRGGASNTLHTIKGLDINITATGLGNISAITLKDDGTIFTADAKSGRIWALADRGQDGTIDVRQPLPFTFQNPTGLAAIGSTLFVADQNAVWVIEAGKHPRELASLKHANSSGAPHRLLRSPDAQSIILGLTSKTDGFRVLKLDTKTGQASLFGEGHYGKLHSFAQRAGADIWVASGSTLGPLGSDVIKFPAGQSIQAIALPGQYEIPQEWPVKLNDHIIAAQTGPKAMQLIAIPTEFGQTSGKPRILAEGFLTRSGRAAWGEPGPLLMDKRGLFFADSHNGVIWRLSTTAKPKPKITIVDTASLPKSPSPQPKLVEKGALKIGSTIEGTQIDASSTIIKPSSIEYGSKLIKDYDEKKALEEAKKTEKAPKKRRRMSRKRKQPE